MNKRKVILYICMSLDGFIATEDDDISWLSLVEKEGEDYGYTEFVKSIDTYIVGRKTYDKVLQLTGGVFPQAEEFECYVITWEEARGCFQEEPLRFNSLHSHPGNMTQDWCSYTTLK
jgi:dihydrofolate reductase